MNLHQFYTDGQKIATGFEGDVYLVPFEGACAAVIDKVGLGRKYLAQERLVKLVNVNKTLAYLPEFTTLDLPAIADETTLNNFSIQGGWNLNTGDADGTYTDYTKPFLGHRITNEDTRLDENRNGLTVIAVAAAVQAGRLQGQKPQYTGLRKVWNKWTGW